MRATTLPTAAAVLLLSAASPGQPGAGAAAPDTATPDKAAPAKAAPDAAAPDAAAARDTRRAATRLLRALELDRSRQTAIAGLVELGLPAVPVLVRGLDDPRPEIVSLVLQALGGIGEPAAPALPRIDVLRGSDDAGVRQAAGWARAGILPEHVLTVTYVHGETLDLRMADHVVERTVLDRRQVWDVEPLDDGGLLITQHTPSAVVELDARGDEVFRFTDLQHPMDADRLLNGHTLIADTQAGRVVEVDRDGRIVWSLTEGVRPNDVDRLLDGNTLVASARLDLVTEHDAEGHRVWQYDGCRRPVDADRLLNGNTLIASYGDNLVREVTRTGEVVFEVRANTVPRDADRLPNGDTVVAWEDAVRIYDRHGEEVWVDRRTGAREVHAR